MRDPYWNHNVHYHRLVLDAVPEGCGEALDVGCGDGLLVRKLARRVRNVTGVDRSAEMVEAARADAAGIGNAAFVEGDYLDGTGLIEGGYAFVSAVAVVHHARFDDAVRGLVRLLAPGGRLVIVGLACNRTWPDRLISGCGVPASRLHALARGGKRAPAGMPVQEPALAWGEVRREARRLLPGCRFRRHLLWRYSVVWDGPVAPPG